MRNGDFLINVNGKFFDTIGDGINDFFELVVSTDFAFNHVFEIGIFAIGCFKDFCKLVFVFDLFF